METLEDAGESLVTKQFKVVVTDFIQDALEPERRVLGDLADVTALDAHGEDDLAGRIEDAARLDGLPQPRPVAADDRAAATAAS